MLTVPLVALVAVMVLGTGTAAAHASVVATNPPDGSMAATAPSRVSITFTEPVSINAGGLTVRDGGGQRVDDGAATTEGTVASTGLRSGLPDGTYVVTYRVLSADGHPVSGSFLFGVGSGALDRSLVDTTGDRQWDVVGDVARGLLLLAALTAAGVAVFLRVVHDGADDRWRLTPFVRVGTIVAFVAAIGAVIAQAALLTGRGAGASTDTDVLRQVMNGDLGLSLAVLFVGLAVVHLSTDVTRTAVARVLALGGGLAVTVSFALWGHATAFTPAWLLMSTDAVHATAAAVWLGGLVGLWVVLAGRGPDEVIGAARIVGRFSTLALWTVLALVVAGVALTVAGSDASWSALVSTTWGRLILTKAALTGVVVLIAAWNRRVLVPSFVGGTHDGPDDGERNRHRLLSTVRVEALAIVVILVLTGVVTNVTPARDVPPAATATDTTEAIDAGSVRLEVRPGRVGTNTLSATYLTPRGEPLDVGQTLTMEFSLPAEGLAPITRRATAVSTGRFEFEGGELSLPGTWTVTLTARLDVFTEARTSFEVTVVP